MIGKACGKYELDEKKFEKWRMEVVKNVEEKIKKNQRDRRFKERKVRPVLKDLEVKRYLEELHEKFVLVPIDKAANNIAVICKKHYVAVMVKELGKLEKRSETYEEIEDRQEEVAERLAKEMKKEFGITVEKEEKVMSMMYWSPKMHKNPSGARFIIASKRCVTKKLARCGTKIFKVFQDMVEKYHMKARFYSGVKTFWVIQNNVPVLRSIEKMTQRRTVRTVDTYDFSTLYTTLPHEKLIGVLHEIVEFCFKGGVKKSLKVTDRGHVSWCKGERYWTAEKVKKMVTFLVKEANFFMGEVVMRQCIGIAMGLDPAPFFANLFLFHYESKWVMKHKKQHLCEARRLVHTFRFIDDLLTINDGGLFENIWADIYPKELQLKKENKTSKEGSFLDLQLTVGEDREMKTKLYDKRDGFNFDIVRMPFLESCIPERIFYATIMSEILRIARATTCRDAFKTTVEALLARMKKQGSIRERLRAQMQKMMRKHVGVFQKYGDNILEYVTHESTKASDRSQHELWTDDRIHG